MYSPQSIEAYCSSVERLYKEIDSLYKEHARNDEINDTCNYIRSEIDVMAVENKLERDCPKATKEEESICGVTEEDKKAVSSFANKYKITESALQSYFVFSKLRSSSGKTNGKPSKCPEKDAMVYLYRDRRDRFECVDSLIRLYVEKLQNENENLILLSNLKGILLSIIQKGYVKMILDLTRSYHTICSSIEDWHLLLILDELQAAYKSILSLFQLTRISKEELYQIQALYLVIFKTQQFACITSLLYCVMIRSLMKMAPFTSSLQYTDLQPNLFDISNLNSLLNDLQSKQFDSLLFILCIISCNEYSAPSSIQQILSLVLHNQELHHLSQAIQTVSYLSQSSVLQADCFQYFFQFIEYCIQFYLSYPSCFYCEAFIHEQLKERQIRYQEIGDGIETFLQCIETILPHLSSSSSLSPLLFQLIIVLIQSISQQPLLFNPTVQYIAQVASVNQVYQQEVYSILQASPSPYISLQGFYTSLDAFFKQIPSLSTNNQFNKDDIKGIEAIFSILTSLIKGNSILREEIMNHFHSQLLSYIIQLLPYSQPPSFFAACFSLLQSLAESPAYAMSIWNELNRSVIINNTSHYNNNTNRITSGLELLFTSIELEQRDFQATNCFVSFFLTLLQNCNFSTIAATPIFIPYLSYLLHTVFIGCYYHPSHAYKYSILTNCIKIMQICIESTLKTKTACTMALIAELLSSSQLVNVLLSIQTLTIHPYPSSSSSQGFESNETILTLNLASSELILALLSISTQFIEENHIAIVVPGITQTVQPFAQQLVLNPSLFMKVLLRVENTHFIELQRVTLQIFFRVIQQLSTPTLLSFFDNYMSEIEMIHGMIQSIFIRTILHHDQDKEYACCLDILKIIIELVNHSSSFLFYLLQLHHSNSIVYSFISYLSSFEFISFYPVLASQLFTFLSQFSIFITKEKKELTAWLKPDFFTSLFSHCNNLLIMLKNKQYPSSSNQPFQLETCQDLLLYSLLDSIIHFISTSYYVLLSSYPTECNTYLGITLANQTFSSILQDLRPFMIPLSYAPYSVFFQQYFDELATPSSLWNYSFKSIPSSILQEKITVFCQQNQIANESTIQQQYQEECNDINRAMCSKAIHESIIQHYYTLLHILLIDWNGYSKELQYSYYQTNLLFLQDHSITPSCQQILLQFLLSLLIHFIEQQFTLSKELLSQSILLITQAITQDTSMQYQELRSIEYYFLLKLFNLINKQEYSSFLHPIELYLPSLLSMLVYDLSNQTAILLLSFLLTMDSTSAVIQYLTNQTDLLTKLLQTIQSLDLSILSSSSSLKTIQFLLSLIVLLASNTQVAMLFLQLSIFSSINHNVLFTSFKEDSNTLVLNSLTASQKDSLRVILSLLAEIVIVLYKSVQSIRSIHIELLSFVSSCLPLIGFIFKEKEGSNQLINQLIGYFIGVLVLAADHPDRFIQAMNGYENVLKSEVINLLNVISKKEEICNAICNHIKKDNDSYNSPYLVIVENSMLFMSKMGWKIGDEYLRAFGVK